MRTCAGAVLHGIDDHHWRVSLTAMRHEGKVMVSVA